MSGWTEFVVARKSEAQAIADEINPHEKWPACDGLKFFGPPQLAPLGEIILNRPTTWEDFNELALGECAFVYELPGELTAAIRMLSDQALEEAVKAWSSRLAAMKEYSEIKELQPVLSELRQLAKQAAKARRPVLL